MSTCTGHGAKTLHSTNNEGISLGGWGKGETGRRTDAADYDYDISAWLRYSHQPTELNSQGYCKTRRLPSRCEEVWWLRAWGRWAGFLAARIKKIGCFSARGVWISHKSEDLFGVSAPPRAMVPLLHAPSPAWNLHTTIIHQAAHSLVHNTPTSLFKIKTQFSVSSCWSESSGMPHTNIRKRKVRPSERPRSETHQVLHMYCWCGQTQEEFTSSLYFQILDWAYPARAQYFIAPCSHWHL